MSYVIDASEGGKFVFNPPWRRRLGCLPCGSVLHCMSAYERWIINYSYLIINGDNTTSLVSDFACLHFEDYQDNTRQPRDGTTPMKMNHPSASEHLNLGWEIGKGNRNFESVITVLLRWAPLNNFLWLLSLSLNSLLRRKPLNRIFHPFSACKIIVYKKTVRVSIAIRIQPQGTEQRPPAYFFQQIAQGSDCHYGSTNSRTWLIIYRRWQIAHDSSRQETDAVVVQ